MRGHKATCVILFAALFWAALSTIGFSQDKERIFVWHSYRGAERAALKDLAQEWNRTSPDSFVSLLGLPYEAYPNKLSSAIPRGQGPDIFIFAHERIGDWADSKLIRPWDDLLPADYQDRFLAPTVEAFRYKGKHYGIPLSFKSVALIYNKKLVPDPPKTTLQMLRIASDLKYANSDVYGLAYEAGSFYHHACWLYGFGGRIFDKEGNLRLNGPGVVRSYEFADELIRTGVIPKEPTSVLVSQLFNEGRAGMVINGPWFLGEIDPKIDYGVAPLPVVLETGLPARPFLTVEGVLLSAYSKNEKKAAQFARFLAVGMGAKKRLQQGRQLVAEKKIYESPDILLDDALTQFKAQAQQAVPMPNDPRMRVVWEPAAMALRSVLRGSKTPVEALDKAQFRLKVLSRKPPEEKNPTLYIAFFILVLFGLCVWVIIRSIKSGALGQIKESRHAYLYLIPAAISMVLLVFIPFVVGTAVAFFAHRNGEFTFVGLSNFINILTSADTKITDPLSFYFTLGVTVMWTVVNVFLHVTIGLALALVLRSPWIRLKGIYRVLLIVPWAVPNYITALIWKGMFHGQFGAINGMLKFMGLESVSWFSHFWTAFAANVTTNTWLGFPFMMVVCLGALQAIPKDLEEAAMMDGANSWTRFTRIILPLIKPALLPAVILGSVWTFNMFNIIYLVSGGEPDGATEILISEAYRWAFSRQEQYGYAAAYATLIFLTLIGYTVLTRRVTGKAEAA